MWRAESSHVHTSSKQNRCRHDFASCFLSFLFFSLFLLLCFKERVSNEEEERQQVEQGRQAGMLVLSVPETAER